MDIGCLRVFPSLRRQMLVSLIMVFILYHILSLLLFLWRYSTSGLPSCTSCNHHRTSRYRTRSRFWLTYRSRIATLCQESPKEPTERQRSGSGQPTISPFPESWAGGWLRICRYQRKSWSRCQSLACHNASEHASMPRPDRLKSPTRTNL